MIRCLCQHARRLNNRAIQRQLSSIGRKRRIEPRRMKIEQRDDKDEQEERAVYTWSIQEVCRGDEKDEVNG
jgi:hypothetical protein